MTGASDDRQARATAAAGCISTFFGSCPCFWLYCWISWLRIFFDFIRLQGALCEVQQGLVQCVSFIQEPCQGQYWLSFCRKRDHAHPHRGVLSE